MKIITKLRIVNCISNIYKFVYQMLSKMNKMLPTFRESSSDCPLMIVTSVHSVLSLQSRNNLQKKSKSEQMMANISK